MNHSPSGFTFDKRVSMGNVIVILGCIASFMFGYSNLSARVQAHDESILSIHSTLSHLESSSTSEDKQITTALGQINARLSAIEANLSWLMKPGVPSIPSLNYQDTKKTQ